VHPFDVYGCTEGLFGSECQHHQGIHLFEDTTLIENVDADGQPVPAGQPGSRLLVTNLSNLVQPLLRLEVTDLVTLDPDPCPCGRSLVRARAIHGRSDDLLSLPAGDGGRVAVHPLHFALLTRDPQVREFQVVQDGPVLRLRIVPRQTATADDALETRLGQAVTQQLLGLGVDDPQVSVERPQQLSRSAGGKLKRVIADPLPGAHTPSPAKRSASELRRSGGAAPSLDAGSGRCSRTGSAPDSPGAPARPPRTDRLG
jgi:phenylacetate-CoA ligase